MSNPTYPIRPESLTRPPVADAWGYETDAWRDEVARLTAQLAAVRAEFVAQYEATPPVFQTRWARVKRLLE